MEDEGVTGFTVESIEEAVEAVGKAADLDRRAVRQRFEERFTAARMARDYVAEYGRLAKTSAMMVPHHRRNANNSLLPLDPVAAAAKVSGGAAGAALPNQRSV